MPDGMVYAPEYEVGRRTKMVVVYKGELRRVQLLNTQEPTVVSVLGIDTVVRFVHSENA